MLTAMSKSWRTALVQLVLKFTTPYGMESSLLIRYEMVKKVKYLRVSIVSLCPGLLGLAVIITRQSGSNNPVVFVVV